MYNIIIQVSIDVEFREKSHILKTNNSIWNSSISHIYPKLTMFYYVVSISA